MASKIQARIGEAAEVLRRSTVRASSGCGLRAVAVRPRAALRAAA